MTTPTDVLNLDPIYIPGLITPVQTDGAVGGVNHNMIHANDAGLLVIVQTYLNMQQGDWIEVFWGDDSTPVAADLVLPEQVGEDFALFIRANRIPEGIHDLYARVTRSGGGNGGESPPLAILVRTEFPGGTDPEPDLPGHQNLAAPKPETDFIDEDAAKNGVKVTIAGYPNMRVFDVITLSWGGELLRHEVTQGEVDAGTLDILVDEATIFEAGASDQLVLVYRVIDEVHNASSDWSIRTYVTVEVGTNLFDAPMVENPDMDADPYDVIDLEKLGDDDLQVNVMAAPGGKLEQGDLITLSWVGTTAQGQPVAFQPPPQSVPRVPVVLMFFIPNADVRQLAHGRGVASYTVTRDDAPAGISKRGHVSFIGVEQRLPRPSVTEAVGGVLDPTLASATAVVPGEALEAGDTVKLTWIGARANGTPLMREFVAGVSGGNAGKPMSFSIPGAELIAPLDGGTLRVYYRLIKISGVELESEREELRVGEAQADLPAPFTRPPAEDGVLDPEQLPAQLEIVVAPWPGMGEGQTVYLVWSASSGPHFDDFMPISAPQVGHEVVFRLDRSHVEANLGAEVELFYRVEAPGEPTRISAVATLRIGSQEDIESGPLRVMGARHRHNHARGMNGPAILSALHDESLLPLRAGWRYEDSEEWTVATEWFDDKPWLKLYVRSRSQTWECSPVNIVGNGIHVNGIDGSAFVAMRDEVMDGTDVVVDMVAWGAPDAGGELGPEQIALKNVAEIAANSYAFAARLRNGDVACWGRPEYGGSPDLIQGNFVEVRGGSADFVGRQSSGDLFAWGHSNESFPIPEHVLQHKDYKALFNTMYAFAGLRESGHVMAWGNPTYGGKMRQGQELFDDIVDVLGSFGAFVALRDLGDGKSVIGWGDTHGGVLPENIAALTNVKRIAATTGHSFCILLESGELKAWPANVPGGTIPDDIARLDNVVEVTASAMAFCARLRSGKVVAWGDAGAGGTLPADIADKTNITQVTGNFDAFAALCSDGTVVAWGDRNTGGDISTVADQLKDVRAIYANAYAFAALTADGRVVTWGAQGSGGSSDHVQPELTGRVTARRLLSDTDVAAVGTAD
ncbi:MAG: hypothetical protein LBJ37_12190 [Paucimonas sp.]|jgi:hypothetical protein|nr:hypothetical protein [Paucimonas sp.]